MFQETARAKINLNLHVGQLVEDPSHKYFGYHPLSSLVAFADYGDEVSCIAAVETSLSITGPFAAALEADRSNLMLRAYDAVAAQTSLPPLEFHLVKNLPIASGIGGGSADAAAVLRLLKNFVSLPEQKWLEIALSLGADVPVCFYSQTCIMTGIGEDISFLNESDPLNAILVNAGEKVSTAKIFESFDQTLRSTQIDLSLKQPSGDLLTRIHSSSNALQDHAPAVDVCIKETIRQLRKHGTTTRMSGSGATCFGIYPSADKAKSIAHTIKSEFPHWWVQPVMLGDL